MIGKRKWSYWSFSSERKLTDERIESATRWWEEQEANFNNKQDTIALIPEPFEDVNDMIDNNIDSGWPYND